MSISWLESAVVWWLVFPPVTRKTRVQFPAAEISWVSQVLCDFVVFAAFGVSPGARPPAVPSPPPAVPPAHTFQQAVTKLRIGSRPPAIKLCCMWGNIICCWAFVEGVSHYIWKRNIDRDRFATYQIRLADRAYVLKFSRHEHPEGQPSRGSPTREPFFEATLSEAPDNKSSLVEKIILCSVRLRIGGMSVPGPPGAG